MPKIEKTLSVFVDESGTFQFPDPSSRFYIIALVFHDQDSDIRRFVRELDKGVENLGLDSDVFASHAGPLIRKEKDFALFRRHLRAKIFKMMFDFARRAEFNYRCLCIDKKYITSPLQIVSRLQNELEVFLDAHKERLQQFSQVKIYYDCGQSPITNLLHKTFSTDIGCSVSFAQNVRPQKYKMFQVADLICTLHLIEQKLEHNLPMTESEYSFFGGPRLFKRNYLRVIKKKEVL